jgi:hypothetical protein
MASKQLSHSKSRAKTSSEMRRMSGDTRVGALRQIYGEDFARGFRSDVRLSTVLDRMGVHSLRDLIRHEIFKQTETVYRPALKRLANK